MKTTQSSDQTALARTKTKSTFDAEDRVARDLSGSFLSLQSSGPALIMIGGGKRRLARERARWLAWKYGVDAERAVDALMRTRIAIPEDNPRSEVPLYSVEPDLDLALMIFKRDLALKLFLSEDPDSVSELLRQVLRLCANHIDPFRSIEELIADETELYMRA